MLSGPFSVKANLTPIQRGLPLSRNQVLFLTALDIAAFRLSLSSAKSYPVKAHLQYRVFIVASCNLLCDFWSGSAQSIQRPSLVHCQTMARLRDHLDRQHRPPSRYCIRGPCEFPVESYHVCRRQRLHVRRYSSISSALGSVPNVVYHLALSPDPWRPRSAETHLLCWRAWSATAFLVRLFFLHS